MRKWRARYLEEGLAGLRDESRPGRPRTLDDRDVADLLNKALQTRPAKQTPPDLELHLIVGNDVTHKHRKVEAWPARNPRFHMHFTHTYSSWLNQLECWPALIIERAIRRSSFTRVRKLKQQIALFVRRYNADASPFQWVATVDSILQKIERIAKRISTTGNQALAMRSRRASATMARWTS